MENKSSSFTIVLAILVLFLGGFLIYDKVINKENDKGSDISIYQNYINNLAKLDKQIEKHVPMAGGPHPIDYIVITKEKKVYAIFSDEVTNQEYLNKLEELSCNKIYGDCFKGYYLGLDNVVKVDIFERGNGGYSYIYFTTNQGEIYSINSNMETYKIEGLKDIITIDYWGEDNTIVAYATDINGNRFQILQ